MQLPEEIARKYSEKSCVSLTMNIILGVSDRIIIIIIRLSIVGEWV